MINNKFVHMKISDIADSDFQAMTAELCHCVGWDKDQFEMKTFSFLLMAIGREDRSLTQQHLPVSGILTTKVNKLPTNGAVFRVCYELAVLNRTHIESFDGKTVLTLIKRCHKFFCPGLADLKKRTRKRSR